MVSVVVPIYNEEELIVRFHEAVAGALTGVVDDWEVVYVNDGSTDSSLDLLKGLQSIDSHVVVVELSRNWGHMGAISAGLHTARGRAVILMDGDFQDPPEVLPEFIEPGATVPKWWWACAEPAGKPQAPGISSPARRRCGRIAGQHRR